MAKMNGARILIALLVATSLAACVRTQRFAAEYKKQYYLAEDVNAYGSYSFTGIYSAWFTGPQQVETICSGKIPVKGAVSLKKGSPVRVVRIFTVSGVDDFQSEAQLRIFDQGTNGSRDVYVKWPASEIMLTTEPPDMSERTIVN